MRTINLIAPILFFIIINTISAQEIPFLQNPDWESTSEGRSTGLGIADINGDGWKDIVIADGNDMARQHLVVYYNQGDGTFPLNPDWESDDIDYHGHLAVGDVNDDGWIDVAVSVYIGESGFNDPGKVKIYYNQGGELEENPSFESYEFYTFSCAFGDADGDGDLDLATTGGEPYSGLYDEGKIFINNNGSFNENPEWTSDFNFGSLDVDFGDLDQNGFLDLVFSSEETPNYIFLANDEGEIQDTAGWTSLDQENYINSLDIGFVGQDKIPAVVMTGNNQLGGDGEVWQYSFPNGVPDSGIADWSSDPFGYGSGILLADVNSDDILDLIYGGWWLPMKIALGFEEGGFETDPSYTSGTASVVEAIQMADLDRDDIQINTETFFPEEGIGSIIYLEKQLVENIISIKVNEIELDDSMFCYVPNKNWISFKNNIEAGDFVEVEYEFSNDCDIVISNWDANKGNYIFYNTLVTGVHEPVLSGGQDAFIRFGPNPVIENLKITYSIEQDSKVTILFYNTFGKLVYEQHSGLKTKGVHRTTADLSNLTKGIYILQLQTETYSTSHKILVN